MTKKCFRHSVASKCHHEVLVPHHAAKRNHDGKPRVGIEPTSNRQAIGQDPLAVACVPNKACCAARCRMTEALGARVWRVWACVRELREVCGGWACVNVCTCVRRACGCMDV